MKYFSAVEDALRTLLGEGCIELHEPLLLCDDSEKLMECIRSGFVSSAGPLVSSFETELAKAVGVEFAVATNSGTSALHLCLLASGVCSGQEVLLPAFNFVAAASAVKLCGGTPHFVDIEPKFLTLDIDALDDYLTLNFFINDQEILVNRKTGREVRCIIPMHTYGIICDMDRLNDLAKRFNLVVIEDAAEALGSVYKGRNAGSLGDLSIVSFNGNKIITTGAGGAVLSNDSDAIFKIRHIAATARVPHPWRISHDEVGFNYRMPALNAALGLSQLAKLPEILIRKRELHGYYAEVFKSVESCKLMGEPVYSDSNFWLNTVLIKDKSVDSLCEYLNRKGLKVRRAWDLLAYLPPYKNCPRSELVNSQIAYDTVFNVPSSINSL